MRFSIWPVLSTLLLVSSSVSAQDAGLPLEDVQPPIEDVGMPMEDVPLLPPIEDLDAGAADTGDDCDGEKSHILALIQGGGFGPVGSLTNLQTLVQDDPDLSARYEAVQIIAYNPNATPSEIAQTVQQGLIAFKNQHPCQMLDIMGHSLGSFSGLLGITAESGLLADGSFLYSWVDTYVSLAGVNQGQDPSLIGNLFSNDLMLALQPSMTNGTNEYLDFFYADQGHKLSAINFCALYSPQDTMVSRPHDSGCYPPGVCHAVDLSGCLGAHLYMGCQGFDEDCVKRVFDAIKWECFHVGLFPPIEELDAGTSD